MSRYDQAENRFCTYETGDKRNLTRPPAAQAVPPLEQITGESVMPFDSPLVPLIPAPGPRRVAITSPQHSQSYLRQHIGENMTVACQPGESGALSDRTGMLVNVGESFIVLRPVDTDDLLMCDLFSIRFVTIYQ